MLRSMASVRGLATCVAALLLVTSVVEAQGQKKKGQSRSRTRSSRGASGQRGGGGATAMQLVSRTEVQKELKITEEQKGIITELQQSSRIDFRSALGEGFRDLSREQQQAKFAEIRKKAAAKTKEAEGDLFGLILDEKQSKRLKEILLQQKGLRALLEPAVAKTVGLTTTQSTKIKKAFDDGDKKRQELFASLRGQRGSRSGSKSKKGAPKKSAPKKGTAKGGAKKKGSSRGGSGLRERFEEMRKKGEAIGAERDKNVLAVLTATQKTKFELMRGAKFELTRTSRGNRGGSSKKRGGSRKGRSRSKSKKKEA
ncbi:MAG: hypothetical protein CMJ65_15515 [Planctomycetaceae bacterium]|nr:hypothetical protein [Planctomycetaceae bacterium]